MASTRCMYSSRCSATNALYASADSQRSIDEIAARRLDVAQELGSDVAAALAEELGPLAVHPVGALELRRVAHLVAEDECDHAA